MNCKITEQQTRQIMRLDGDVTPPLSLYSLITHKCVIETFSVQIPPTGTVRGLYTRLWNGMITDI